MYYRQRRWGVALKKKRAVWRAGGFFFLVCDKNIHSQKFSANPDGVHVTHLRKSTGKQTPKLRLLALYCSSGAIHVKTWPTLSYIIFELKYMPHASVLSESSHLKGQTTLIMHTHTHKKSTLQSLHCSRLNTKIQNERICSLTRTPCV